MQKDFTTMDVWIAGYLSLKGVEPSLENRNGKIIFTFETSNELYRLLDSFNSNELVPVNNYCQRVKILRGKLLSMKEEDGNGRRNGSYNRF